MSKKYDAIVMFSGGLDSLLSAKLLEQQGLRVLCLHFFSPFFGSDKVSAWKCEYGLDIEAADAGREFTAMLAAYPRHGTGKVLNPCIDCKITLLRLAREMMPSCGAQFIATGEVLGQRPMSQRADTMNAIIRDSGCAGILLRPLSALLLPQTPMEERGLVDRSRLMRISGRGRNDQLDLAKSMGISKIPAPGGGCRLTEPEAARRYWPLLRDHWLNKPGQRAADLAGDFQTANHGRVLFRRDTGRMLCIGRNERDNAKLAACKDERDLLIRLPFPGPLALARRGETWREEELQEAASVAAAYAPKAKGMAEVAMRIVNGAQRIMPVKPDKQENIWFLPSWEQDHEEIRLCRKEKMVKQTTSRQGMDQSKATRIP